jgi:hypothetical protein
MLKYRSLAALEAAHANARSAANKCQLRAKAVRLAAELGQPCPAWAAPTPPSLPSELERYLAAHGGARVLLLRGGVALDDGHGGTRRFPTLAACAAAVT